MQIVSLAVAAVACGTGLRAAYLWWKASRIPVVPAWYVEPGEAEASMQGWIAAHLGDVEQIWHPECGGRCLDGLVRWAIGRGELVGGRELLRPFQSAARLPILAFRCH
jgi:hypothetical protein